MLKKFTGAIFVVLIVFAVSFGGHTLFSDKKCVSPEASSIRPTSAQSAILLGQKIDINAATKQDLEALPGIGPSIAERIVKYRAQHGRFKSLEEMDNVSGIGPKTVERLKEFLACHPERSEGSRLYPPQLP